MIPYGDSDLYVLFRTGRTPSATFSVDDCGGPGMLIGADFPTLGSSIERAATLIVGCIVLRIEALLLPELNGLSELPLDD